MKHLRSFESFAVNEEIMGLPKLSEIKSQAKEWLSKNKNNPEFKKALQDMKSEFEKLDPKTQSKLKSLANKSSQEIQSEVESSEMVGESMINEGVNWKSILGKFFKVLGITSLGGSFITAIGALITMATYGSGSASMLGSTADHVGALGMITMMAAIVPMVIGMAMKSSAESKA
jgi:uncharacterized membrane-anchored protein YjiN (DUF445 family)